MGDLHYLTVDEARPLPGLRVAITRGIPGPWGIAVRAILEYKKIDFATVAQLPGQDNPELLAWTGQTSAPVAMLDGERPRAIWSEILMLAERLAPEPRLVPVDEEERAAMFGLVHELCAEDGLGWNIRTLIFEGQAAAGQDNSQMLRKYGSGTTGDHAIGRVNAIIAMLDRRLAAQQARGRSFLIGDALSAADIYWVAFSNLLVPLAAELCEVPDFYRAFAERCRAVVTAPLDALIAHRDRIARDCFDAPMRF